MKTAQDNFNFFSRTIAESFRDAKEIQRQINEELYLEAITLPEVTGYLFDDEDEEELGADSTPSFDDYYFAEQEFLGQAQDRFDYDQDVYF